MTKSDLINAAAKACCCSKSATNKCIDAVIDNIKKSLKKGEKVTLVGFGTFSVKKRAARIGRNPQTGKPLKISARKVPAFKAGSELKAAVR